MLPVKYKKKLKVVVTTCSSLCQVSKPISLGGAVKMYHRGKRVMHACPNILGDLPTEKSPKI